MPSFWTHVAFAESCMRELAARNCSSAERIGYLSDAITAHPHAFFTGMQGPDLFLFYLPAALRKRRLSTVLHTEQTAKLLCCLFTRARAFEGEDRRRALSYVCGFLGHYLLDSHSHAFVYAKAGTRRSAHSFSVHNALEADLNRLIVRRSLGVELHTLSRPRSYHLSATERRILSSLLSSALREVYGINCSPAKVGRAFHSVNLATGLLYDANGKKGKFARQLERPLGRPYLSPLFLGETHYYTDPANLAHRTWIDPFTGTPSQASFFDLFDRAQARYLPLLSRLEAPEMENARTRRSFFEKLCIRDFHGEPIR